jgi:hypothetical protein
MEAGEAEFEEGQLMLGVAVAEETTEEDFYPAQKVGSREQEAAVAVSLEQSPGVREGDSVYSGLSKSRLLPTMLQQRSKITAQV